MILDRLDSAWPYSVTQYRWITVPLSIGMPRIEAQRLSAASSKRIKGTRVCYWNPLDSVFHHQLQRGDDDSAIAFHPA